MKIFRTILMGLIIVVVSTSSIVWQIDDTQARRTSNVRMTFYVATWGSDSNNNLGNSSRKPLRSLSKAIQQASRADYGTIRVLGSIYSIAPQDRNINKSINYGNNVSLIGRSSRIQTVIYNPYRSLSRMNITVNNGQFSVNNIYFKDMALNITTNRSAYAEIAGNRFELSRTYSSQPLLTIKTNGSSWIKVHQNDIWLNNKLATNQSGILSNSNGTGGTIIMNNKFRFNARKGKKLIGIKAIGSTAGTSQIYVNKFYGGQYDNVALNYDNVIGKIYFVSNNLRGFRGSISKKISSPHLNAMPIGFQQRLTGRQQQVIQTTK